MEVLKEYLANQPSSSDLQSLVLDGNMLSDSGVRFIMDGLI